MQVDDQQRRVFAETGILNFKRLIPKSQIDPVKDHILAELQRLQLRENGKWLTKKFESMGAFQVSAKLGQKFKHHAHLDSVIPSQLVAYLDILTGTELLPAQARPQVLFTLPQKDKWELPEHGWHRDIAFPVRDVIPGVQIFVLIDDVVPKGGATMAISGSHKLKDLEPTPDRIVEMSGHAGDVFLMDMRIRHSPSINSSKNARMMLTSRYMNPKF